MTNIGSWIPVTIVVPCSSGSFWWSSVQVILREWLWHLITRSSQWKSTLSVNNNSYHQHEEKGCVPRSEKRAFCQRKELSMRERNPEVFVLMWGMWSTVCSVRGTLGHIHIYWFTAVFEVGHMIKVTWISQISHRRFWCKRSHVSFPPVVDECHQWVGMAECCERNKTS